VLSAYNKALYKFICFRQGVVHLNILGRGENLNSRPLHLVSWNQKHRFCRMV